MSSLKNGEPVPDIVLKDTDGEEWRLSDYRGKMVIIHACRGEF
ncbi:MAG: redoxin domain-containing protein [Armatimonadota bacterium]